MTIKTLLNYSPSFNSIKDKKRNKIYYFSLYRNEKRIRAINKLTNIQSEVSCHYLIKNNGEIIKMVPDYI